jgi:hypothetical protein
MLQSIIETIVESGLRVVGWAVLKSLTFGRYRGFQPGDTVREGAVGLAVLAAVGYGVYGLWLR